MQALLVTSTYTANLAAFVTVQSINSNVQDVAVRFVVHGWQCGVVAAPVWRMGSIWLQQDFPGGFRCPVVAQGSRIHHVWVLRLFASVQDLRGKAVGTSPIYVDRLRKVRSLRQGCAGHCEARAAAKKGRFAFELLL